MGWKLRNAVTRRRVGEARIVSLEENSRLRKGRCLTICKSSSCRGKTRFILYGLRCKLVSMRGNYWKAFPAQQSQEGLPWEVMSSPSLGVFKPWATIWHGCCRGYSHPTGSDNPSGSLQSQVSDSLQRYLKNSKVNP